MRLTTAAEDVAAAWPAEQAEEALRRIVTVLLHSSGPMWLPGRWRVLCLACDALGIDEPVLVSDPAVPRLLPRAPWPPLPLAG